MTQNNVYDRDAQIAALRKHLAVERACREFDLPPELLSAAKTPDEVDRLAGDFLAWKASTAPPPVPTCPPTAAVSASLVTSADKIAMVTGQITSRDQLAQLGPAERMRAWREGRLQQFGVCQPRPPQSTPLHRQG